MRLVAFAGPSLPPRAREAFPEVEWRPPAEAGDLLEFANMPARKLCLIDGFFDHRPAVRHKEILLLLSQGVPLYGAASIGALRAAEMEALGMIGIGSIFHAYRRGTVVGDDEVALVHGPAEWDWRPLSVPLVDVRATLCHGLRSGVMDLAAARAMLAGARAIHYVDRTWEGVLERFSPDRRSKVQLGGWLKAEAVDQKTIDAIACIRFALADRRAQWGRRPDMVMTPFLQSLAAERGASLPHPN